MIPVPGAYEFLPHTADAKFLAYGATLEELFANCARAMFAIITDIRVVKPKKEFPIRVVTGKNEQAALFDFLDHLIFLLDTEGFLLHDCTSLKIVKEKGSYIVTGKVIGDYHKGYETAGSVKAITYSDMKIERTEKGFVAQVVVDI